MTEIPEGSIESHGITITYYITPNGESAYVVEAVGDAEMTSYLGLLVVGQREILRWSDDE